MYEQKMTAELLELLEEAQKREDARELEDKQRRTLAVRHEMPSIEDAWVQLFMMGPKLYFAWLRMFMP